MGIQRRAAAAVLVSAVAASSALVPADAAQVPQVDWSDRSVVAGKTVKAVVDPDSRPQGADLLLQRKYLDGWRVEDPEAERTKKGFVLTVPTDQLGRFRYRVIAQREGEVVSSSPATTITVRPPYRPLGKPRQHRLGEKPPVRWDPCQPIRWTFNPAHAPRRGLKQVKQGFARIHLATGLDFRYLGKTRQKPNPYGSGLRQGEVIIGWRTAADYRPFRQSRGTVGLGGSSFQPGYQEADGTRVSKALSGGVVLNASQKGRLRNGYGKGVTWGEVIIHEIGHVVGLGHAPASTQIMYFQVTRRNTDWGAGDLAGLARLGDQRGCLEPRGGARTLPVQRYAER